LIEKGTLVSGTELKRGDGVADFIFGHRWLLIFERSYGFLLRREAGVR
jgi:hypothetical protein